MPTMSMPLAPITTVQVEAVAPVRVEVYEVEVVVPLVLTRLVVGARASLLGVTLAAVIADPGMVLAVIDAPLIAPEAMLTP